MSAEYYANMHKLDNDLIRGYNDAKITILSRTSYEEHQVARAWLESANGQLAKKKADAERIAKAERREQKANIIQ